MSSPEGDSVRPFHLAFPVIDLVATERFYVDVIGCGIGRRTDRSLNLNMHGHQIVAHLVTTMPDMTDGGRVDGKKVPPFHFGIILEPHAWEALRDRLIEHEVRFRIPPHIRYPGSIGDQRTLFLDDPSGNAIEFKSFEEDERIFAVMDGRAHVEGGGRIP